MCRISILRWSYWQNPLMLRVTQSWSVLQGLVADFYSKYIFTCGTFTKQNHGYKMIIRCLTPGCFTSERVWWPRLLRPPCFDNFHYLRHHPQQDQDHRHHLHHKWPVFWMMVILNKILNKITSTATIFIMIDTCLLDAGEDRSVPPPPLRRLVFAGPTSLPAERFE